MTRSTMPEPGYTSGGPPSLFHFILGLIVLFVLAMLLKSCL